MADQKKTIQTPTARDCEDIESGFTYNELAQEIINEALLPFLDEEKEITIQMMVARTGRTSSSIRSILEKKVEAGELKKHQVMRRSDGQMVVAYYKPEREEE